MSLTAVAAPDEPSSPRRRLSDQSSTPRSATRSAGGAISPLNHSGELSGGEPSPRPDPRRLAQNLARCVTEILAGARDLDQISRWVSDEVYRHLRTRVVLAARARSARGQAAASRPVFAIGSVRISEPASGVVEAVVMLHGRVRSRAVALRMEALGSRWRATAVHVL